MAGSTGVSVFMLSCVRVCLCLLSLPFYYCLLYFHLFSFLPLTPLPLLPLSLSYLFLIFLYPVSYPPPPLLPFHSPPSFLPSSQPLSTLDADNRTASQRSRNEDKQEQMILEESDHMAVMSVHAFLQVRYTP